MTRRGPPLLRLPFWRGADLLVVGRTVTGAEAPERAARQLTDEVLAAIEGGAFGPAQA